MQITETIEQCLREGRTRFAFELLPPLKGDGTAGVFSAIDPLMEFDPAYINVTYHREDVKYVEHPSGLLEKRIVRLPGKSDPEKIEKLHDGKALAPVVDKEGGKIGVHVEIEFLDMGQEIFLVGRRADRIPEYLHVHEGIGKKRLAPAVPTEIDDILDDFRKRNPFLSDDLRSQSGKSLDPRPDRVVTIDDLPIEGLSLASSLGDWELTNHT